MFVSASFIKQKKKTKPKIKLIKCPSEETWLSKLWYTYEMEYYTEIKNNNVESCTAYTI